MQPLGYTFLIERFRLNVPAPYKKSYLSNGRERIKEIFSSGEEEYFPARFKTDDSWQRHLLFAMKYEGVNPTVLKALFSLLDEAEVTALVRSRKTSVVLRRIWFFYEFLTGRQLPVPPIKTGNYDYALPPEEYFTLSKNFSSRATRQRLFCNLPGDSVFFPIVRLTKKIKAALDTDFKEKISTILSKYPTELVYRANAFLYLKETKSSFAIERQTPSQKRTAAFMEMLKLAGTNEATKDFLIRLQNGIVEERYAESDFRRDQVYVGQSLAPGQELVHFIGAKPEDVPAFMDSFLASMQKIVRSDCSPVIAAAVFSFAFVFIHPFDDGNGRLHRYLMHHILSAMKFTPPNVIFPVSAVLYKNPIRYDLMLESFSKQLMPLVDYRLDASGTMTVENETADSYRYINFTTIAEHFFDVMTEALEAELVPELDYLISWERARERMRDVIDMPERKAMLFITLTQQNNGVFPKSRREMFRELSTEEIAALEKIVREEILSRNAEK